MIGDSTVLTIYTTRAPDSSYATNMTESESATPSDLRRIVYWLGENGGMCRQEMPWVTGESVYNVDGPVLESDKTDRDYTIAQEVSELSFEYYDINLGTTDDAGWVTEWDGREAGPDGTTPKGPPAAIRVSFSIKYVNAKNEQTTRYYRHVIPIITSSGPNSTEQLQSPDASDTTSSGTTTTQSGQ